MATQTTTVTTARIQDLVAAGRWPEWLPRTYDGLYKDFGAFVIHLLRKYNKVDSDPRDLINHVWVKLLEADVLIKYAEGACSEPPETLTTEEAAEFLGITLDQFFNYLRTENCILGEPVTGTRYSKVATWLMTDMLEVVDIPRFRKPDGITLKLPAPKVSRSHFTGYLARAIHNIFVNYCRTRTRKHKERPGDCFTQLRPLSDDPTSWEDRLSDEADSNERRVEILHLTNRVRHTLPGRESEVLVLLEQGYSLAESIGKLDGLTSAHKRIAIRALRA